jgi:hypothetical protein
MKKGWVWELEGQFFLLFSPDIAAGADIMTLHMREELK